MPSGIHSGIHKIPLDSMESSGFQSLGVGESKVLDKRRKGFEGWVVDGNDIVTWCFDRRLESEATCLMDKKKNQETTVSRDRKRHRH